MMLGTNTDIKKITENWIPENSVGAEIGIWRGDTSKQLLTKCSYLHMIDPYNISVYENTTDWLNMGYEKILERYTTYDLNKIFFNYKSIVDYTHLNLAISEKKLNRERLRIPDPWALDRSRCN